MKPTVIFSMGAVQSFACTEFTATLTSSVSFMLNHHHHWPYFKSTELITTRCICVCGQAHKNIYSYFCLSLSLSLCVCVSDCSEFCILQTYPKFDFIVCRNQALCCFMYVIVNISQPLKKVINNYLKTIKSIINL